MTRAHAATAVARWQGAIADHPDLAAAVTAGQLRLKEAARQARTRTREAERNAHNALLEAQYEEGWRQAPLMTCPNGHACKCQGCAEEYRLPQQ